VTSEGDPTLDELIERTRALPGVVHSLRVETWGWSDWELSSLASERTRGLLVRRRPRPADEPTSRHETRTRSWMEFGDDDAWGLPMFEVWPVRWREEHDLDVPYRNVSRVVSGRDHDAYWWDHGDDVKVSDATRMKISLACAWVVGQAWIGQRAQRELLGRGPGILDRSTVGVRVTPPSRGLSAGILNNGDEHELTVDVDTGLTLAVDSFLDGTRFRHHEVTDLEINALVPAELTAPPEDAERVPISSPVRSVEEVAEHAEFAVLAPQWLPPGYTFQTGSARRHSDDTPEVSLIFSLERHEFVQFHERPEETFPMERDRTEWERVDRGGRTVYISDRSDAQGQRIAHTTFAGTLAYAHADLSAPDFLELMFSLAVVPAGDA
jgi:hypothetical protein